MKRIVRRNGEPVLLDTSKDEPIFSGHENVGPRQNRWIELWVHEMVSGEIVPYLVHVSLWQGERTYIEEINSELATDILYENFDDLSDPAAECAKCFGLLDLEGLK
jgi:hypothetical protein